MNKIFMLLLGIINLAAGVWLDLPYLMTTGNVWLVGSILVEEN